MAWPRGTQLSRKQTLAANHVVARRAEVLKVAEVWNDKLCGAQRCMVSVVSTVRARSCSDTCAVCTAQTAGSRNNIRWIAMHTLRSLARTGIQAQHHRPTKHVAKQSSHCRMLTLLTTTVEMSALQFGHCVCTGWVLNPACEWITSGLFATMSRERVHHDYLRQREGRTATLTAAEARLLWWPQDEETEEQCRTPRPD